MVNFRGWFKMWCKSHISAFIQGVHKTIMADFGYPYTIPIAIYLVRIHRVNVSLSRPGAKMLEINLPGALPENPSVRFPWNFVISCVHVSSVFCPKGLENLGQGPPPDPLEDSRCFHMTCYLKYLLTSAPLLLSLRLFSFRFDPLPWGKNLATFHFRV